MNSNFALLQEGKVTAAKAFMLARMIKSGNFSPLEENGKYVRGPDQLALIKEADLEHLNKLKGINPEAAYYLALESRA